MNGWPTLCWPQLRKGGRSSAQQAASSGSRSSVQAAFFGGRSSVQQAGSSVTDAEGKEVRQGVVPEPVQKETMLEGVGFRQGVVPEPVQKGDDAVQPSVPPPPVLVPTLRQCVPRRNSSLCSLPSRAGPYFKAV